ncbi:hypothetical protein FRB99_001977 [Tulasnella sp. 403]|nr:hypothetical protein FRB99_001977 [Tulasnella sp. 403]
MARFPTCVAVVGSVLASVTCLQIKVTGPAAVTSVDDLILTTTVNNNGAEPVTLVNDPNSVLTPDWPTEVFQVTGPNGTAATFTGVRVKWAPTLAVASGLVKTIGPDETINLEHHLAGVYDFTTSGVGDYSISVGSSLYALDPAGGLFITAANVESHTVNIAGSLSPSKPGVIPNPGRKRAFGFLGCNAAQQNELTTAAQIAQRYISNAVFFLAGLAIGSGTGSIFGPPKAPLRYTTWFGEYTAARGDLVRRHFALMNNDPLDTTYECGCGSSEEPGVVAFVRSGEPGLIHLCNLFWTYPTQGHDSKAGTIVHESAHFFVNGGIATDFAYGPGPCQDLAKAAPDTAVRNAESHQFFAENEPPL